jgi:hypothetical protein
MGSFLRASQDPDPKPLTLGSDKEGPDPQHIHLFTRTLLRKNETQITLRFKMVFCLTGPKWVQFEKDDYFFHHCS